jgi:hypothetical protein
MKRFIAPVVVLFALLAASPDVHGQMSNLAGTWALNQEAGGGGGGRGGRGGGIPGVPLATQLIVKVSPTEVTVDTNTGSAQSMQTAVYKVDGTETTVPGPLGWTVKARAAWKDSTLVVNTVRSLEGPNGPLGAEIVDVYSVSGDVLTLERTQGRNKQKLVYNRKS